MPGYISNLLLLISNTSLSWDIVSLLSVDVQVDNKNSYLVNVLEGQLS